MSNIQKLRFAGVILAAGLVYAALSEYSLGRGTDGGPKKITCAELGDLGSRANPYIEMTDFLLCEQGYIYKEEHGKWKAVWIPAVPFQGEYHERVVGLLDQGVPEEEIPPPDDLRVIVKLTSVKNEYDVSLVGEQETVTGMVINRISSLGTEEKKLLREGYPGIDFDRCWIVHVGRTPMSGAVIFGMLVGAVVLLVIALWPWVSRLWANDEPPEPQYESPVRNVRRVQSEHLRQRPRVRRPVS